MQQQQQLQRQQTPLDLLYQFSEHIARRRDQRARHHPPRDLYFFLSTVADLCASPPFPPSLTVPLEAADLVSISPPWESSGGKREVMLASPGGLARYWPDIHSPRRYTDVDARAVAPGQSVSGRFFWYCGVF